MVIREFDKNNNLIHWKNSNDYEIWRKFDKNNNVIYYKNSNNDEFWWKFDKYRSIEITKKEFEWIEFKKKEKEFNSREKVSRFQLMDI